MALMISQVQSKRVLLIDVELLMRDVVVPANEVDRISEAVSVRPIITRAFLIPLPRPLLRLRITV